MDVESPEVDFVVESPPLCVDVLDPSAQADEDASPVVLDDDAALEISGGGPGGGGPFWAMLSSPAASSEVDNSPSPLESNAEKALDIALASASLELMPKAVSTSARLTEPSLLVPISLARSEARVVAAVSSVEDVLDEDVSVDAVDDEVLDEDEPVVDVFCREVRADNVSELKR